MSSSIPEPARLSAWARRNKGHPGAGSVGNESRSQEAACIQINQALLTICPSLCLALSFERVFQRGHDALLRPAGFTVKPSLASVETDASAAYRYEPEAGRVGSVGGLAGGQVRAFAYTRHPARPGLPDTTTGPMHTVKHIWEESRDVLQQRRNLQGDGSTNSEGSAFLYTVNNVPQRTAVTATGTAVAAGTGWTWGYDDLGQVTSAAHSLDGARNRAFVFDDIGNRKQSGTAFQPVSTTGYTPNLLNQYSGIQPPVGAPIAPTYDADGNQLTGHRHPLTGVGMNFEWDGENRLKVVRDGNGVEVARYHYDHIGRRVMKSVAGTGAHTAWVYDGWNPVAEYTLATAPALLVRRNVWSLDLSGSMQGAGGVGGLLATERTDTASPGVWYPCYDGNGNITEYLDLAGAAVANYEYGPFGETLSATSPAANANPWRFSTKPQDEETGLYYYGCRYFDTGSGRWLNRDPVGEGEGINLYSFSYNACINEIDILGLDVDKFTPNCVGPISGKGFEPAPSFVWSKDLFGKKASISVFGGVGEEKQCCTKCDDGNGGTLSWTQDRVSVKVSASWGGKFDFGRSDGFWIKMLAGWNSELSITGEGSVGQMRSSCNNDVHEKFCASITGNVNLSGGIYGEAGYKSKRLLSGGLKAVFEGSAGYTGCMTRKNGGDWHLSGAKYCVSGTAKAVIGVLIGDIELIRQYQTCWDLF